jgi:hypothetical protein
MQFHFWYILIHVTLGILGAQWFTFTNIGGLYAAAAAALVQAYGVYEIHRVASPKFEDSLRAAPSHMRRQEMIKEYRIRVLRVWFFRTCIYGLLTLIAAMAARGGERI